MSYQNWSVINSTRSISDITFYEQINRLRWNENLNNSKIKRDNPNDRHNENLKNIFKIVCPLALIIILIGLLCLFLIPLVQAASNTNTNSNTNKCTAQEFWNGSICVSKKLYQEPCNSSIDCDDTKKLICPTVSGLCNCPNISTSYKCDCSPDYFWDFTKKECTPRRSYGESCAADYQCLQSRNFNCSGVCTCPLTLIWNGYMCDLNFFRFFTYTNAVTSVTVCGNYTISNGRSIEPGNSLNYVMDVNNDIVAIFDSDWNCYSVKSVLNPRFMKVVENDIYISTDYGLKKYDSNFNNLITLNSSANYRRLHYDKLQGYIIANNYVQSKIDTYDRDLNLIDSFNVKILNYSQSASGLYLYKDYWFVGTDANQILIIRNKTIESVYQNICGIRTSVNVCVDNYGNMAVACTGEKKLYLYYINGTYQNLYLNTTSNPNYLNYDSKGRVVATGGGSVDIFS